MMYRKILSLFLIALVSNLSPAVAQEPQLPGSIPLEAFAQLPGMQQVRLSPDGTHLAYLRPISGRAHLVIQTMGEDGKQPVVIPPAETTDFDWLQWANNDRLVFSASAQRKRGGVETVETRLLAVNSDGSDSIYLIKPSKGKRTGSNMRHDFPPAQIQDKVIGWLPDEPNYILVSLDGDQNAADEIRRIDVRSGNYTVVQPDREGIQNWVSDQTGEPRFGWGYDDKTFKVMTRESGGVWTTATEASWRDIGYFPQAFSADPNVVYMIGPDENGIEILVKMEISSGEFVESVLSREGFDVGGLLTDSFTGFPVGAHITEHQTELIYFDKTLAALQRAVNKVMPDTVNQIVSTSRDRRKVLVLSSSDTDPGSYSYLDRDIGALEMIAEAMPGLSPDLMSPVEPISYFARDGQEIQGYLTVPLGREKKNLKMVVLPHGGPAARDDKSFWFLSQFIASRGYAVFQPNFRGSTGYGRVFEFAGRKEWGGLMQQDVTDGVLSLVENGIADPEQLCILGWSYGGYSAAMGAVQTPDLYQCAASINGVLNLARLIADDKKYIGGSVWTRHMGLEDTSLHLVSPYHQIEQINIPFLIIQAKDDARVHLDQGKRMARQLKKQKKEVEYVEVSLGGHSMKNAAARAEILRSVEAFLQKNLAGDR